MEEMKVKAIWCMENEELETEHDIKVYYDGNNDIILELGNIFNAELLLIFPSSNIISLFPS